MAAMDDDDDEPNVTWLEKDSLRPFKWKFNGNKPCIVTLLWPGCWDPFEVRVAIHRVRDDVVEFTQPTPDERAPALTMANLGVPHPATVYDPRRNGPTPPWPKGIKTLPHVVAIREA
jgi:hypothetical protein